jgi:hypothetical protein
VVGGLGRHGGSRNARKKELEKLKVSDAVASKVLYEQRRAVIKTFCGKAVARGCEWTDGIGERDSDSCRFTVSIRHPGREQLARGGRNACRLL